MRNIHWIRAVQLTVTASVVMGGLGQASQVSSLSSQMAGMAGSNLTRAECEQRVQELAGMLQRAGYGPVQTVAFADGTLIVRWYHSGTRQTALAFSGQKATGNVFEASEYAGVVRLNEFRGLR
ncbi:hypothetical protein GCM10008955_36840 [Deinococcus malanensis]|uniref:Uncharacterized protein n=1 Tax=Deinococcus malanensis TaxID=1706855 RepID=A0ABQ2F403_9DEIO|nr:hypothetical protein [Deinococcus malanensis]GGK39633.1 hypothetical protein GCM10008955_36840 [Deinococcus malanensis]